MSTYSILDSPPYAPSRDIDTWSDSFKNQQMEMSHDQSMLNLVTPDECLIVVGPPRLHMAGDTGGSTDFYVVGFVSGFTYSETSQVQPLKAIGSRRHIFARTNQPVQGNIQRMMFFGNNMYRALYSLTKSGQIESHPNSKYYDSGSENNSTWYANLEEDLFRIPFGMGIVYQSPSSNTHESSSVAAGAEYIECMTLANRNVSFQSGQATVMEQVQFLADRVIPWTSFASPYKVSDTNPDVGIS